MIGNWKEADSKLKEIFSDEQTRSKIRGALLNKSEEERLNYFVGDDEEELRFQRSCKVNFCPRVGLVFSFL
jgi:hypothetical protein